MNLTFKIPKTATISVTKNQKRLFEVPYLTVLAREWIMDGEVKVDKPKTKGKLSLCNLSQDLLGLPKVGKRHVSFVVDQNSDGTSTCYIANTTNSEAPERRELSSEGKFGSKDIYNYIVNSNNLNRYEDNYFKVTSIGEINIKGFDCNVVKLDLITKNEEGVWVIPSINEVLLEKDTVEEVISEVNEEALTNN